MGIVIVALHRGFFKCEFHALYLFISPLMADFCEAVLDMMFQVNPIKDRYEGMVVHFTMGKRNAVIGQNDTNCLGSWLRL
jgi:hypothetical protein